MMRQNSDAPLTELIDVREAEIARIAESAQDLAELRAHVEEITKGKAFKGSHRSGQFLIYIVEQAVAGHFDSLKERVIGIELFGRSPTYDTSEDAIVRVTASDVRKRLLQHYGENGATPSKFRLTLLSGSYLPEVTRIHIDSGPTATNIVAASVPPGNIKHDGSNGHVGAPPQISDALAESSQVDGPQHQPRRNRRILYAACSLLALGSVFWGSYWYRSPSVHAKGTPVLPWSAFFASSRATHLITSDPNIVSIQEITGSELLVSDYANRKYIPEPNKLTPEDLRLCRIILWGDNSAAGVDPPIAVRISALAQSGSSSIDARAARSIQLSDLKTDDNFIFLGSPRSNPWSSLFSDLLDFRFEFDKATRQEIIRNVHPRLHELSAYVPTAVGWATGRSYAIIAFVHNPDQNGQVLLLAGANGEGTEAAGKFVTDLPRLATALNRCGIHSDRGSQHFELLLELDTLAGSPNKVDLTACHILPK